MNRRRVIIIAALFWTNFSNCAHSTELITLRYGQNAASAGSLSSLPLTVAERKGFFVREGINLEVVPIPGGTDRIVAALDKGEIDTGKNATPYLIQAVLKGSDAVAIVAQTANPVYSLIARPEIKNFADLKANADSQNFDTSRLDASKFQGGAILSWDGGKVLLVDEGEPGRDDYFQIIAPPGAATGGLLAGGNIQMHGKCL